MKNLESLSKQQLLEMLGHQQKETARDKDVIRQLKEKYRQLEKDYLQLFRDRFVRKSERYIANPNQLRIDFGDTDDAAGAAAGLAEAVSIEVTVGPAGRRDSAETNDSSTY